MQKLVYFCWKRYLKITSFQKLIKTLRFYKKTDFFFNVEVRYCIALFALHSKQNSLQANIIRNEL